MRRLLLIAFLFASCQPQQPQHAYEFMTAKQTRYFDQFAKLEAGYSIAINDQNEAAFVNWAKSYFTDSLRSAVDWVGIMKDVHASDNIITFEIQGYNGEILKGIATKKDNVFHQLEDVPIKEHHTSFVQLSFHAVGDPEFKRVETFEVPSITLTVILDSIKLLPVKEL
jgi:hypothetical protein